MAGDFKQNGENFTIEGKDFFFYRGESEDSVGVNLKNSTGYWHLSAPRTWEEKNPLSIFWIDNTTWHGPFFTINTEGTVGIRHLSVGEVNRELVIVPQEEQDPVSLMLMNGTGLWRMIGPVSSEPGNPLWIGWQDREDWHGPAFSITTDGQVSVRGDFQAATVAQTSSRTLKENIAELSEQEAVEALTELNPVKFNFKADQQKELHVGFIAEDVPPLVAMGDRQTLSSMEIVAVLTKVVQQQQQAISALTAEVKALKQQAADA